MEGEITDVSIIKSRRTYSESMADKLITEEPLEIQLCQVGQRPAKSIAVTMRTPGDDKLLAMGFLYSEGIITSADAIDHISFPIQNTIRLSYKNAELVHLENTQRNFYSNSSCGVCGKASIDSVRTDSNYDINKNDFQVSKSLIWKCKEQLRSVQNLFSVTGGNHAAALFDRNGLLIFMKEDVGRHNAMDKLIGQALLTKDVHPTESFLLLSGRCSFELVQKASMVGIPLIASVGAPSSLAFDLAYTNGQTLIGFLKDESYNIYTHPQRLID